MKVPKNLKQPATAYPDSNSDRALSFPEVMVNLSNKIMNILLVPF